MIIQYAEQPVKTSFSGTCLLITGGAGFLGSKLCQYILDNDLFSRVVILSRGWQQQDELRQRLGDPQRFRWFIGDVRDKDRLLRAFNGVDYIIHAAALKSVPAGEYNPGEVLKTNCEGTQNVIDAAIDCDVKRVIFVSSDKACSPINTYGASKLLGEHIFTSANSYSPTKTKFSSVRYGNVSGSSGSVIPIFLSQKNNNKITITHPKMTRFWITPNQAVTFILRCLFEMLGGEIFVPHLPSSRVTTLATVIAPQAEIEIVGIRSGEKLHEVMLTPEESPRTRDLGWAYRIEPQMRPWGGPPYSGGSPVPADWTYSSASAERLGEEELRRMLSGPG